MDVRFARAIRIRGWSKFADGPPYVTRAQFGDRHTRAYNVSGSRFYVVCERTEANGPMKIAGIFVP